MSTHPIWRLQLLDGPRVHSDTQTITRFRSHCYARLLARLALPVGRTRTRDELADLFWPDARPEVGRANVRNALASLRRQLEGPGIARQGEVLALVGRSGIALRPEAVTTDVAEFEAALRRKDDAAAVALYHGPLLPGFYDDWILWERERLTALYAASLLRLSRQAECRGEIDRARDLAAQAADADPLCAEAQEVLARLRLRAPGAPSGSKGGAAHSVPATPYMAPSAVVPGPALLPPLHLPGALSRFFGREQETTALTDLLGRENARLVTLTGPGGSGKTRLAVTVARALGERRRYPGGVYFVPLAEVSGADAILGAVARALGLASSAALAVEDQVAAALRDAGPTLLVLDNFEHLAASGGTEPVRRLLDAAPQVALLVTSQQPLLLDGEREAPLGPLPVPPAPPKSEQDPTPDELLVYPSVALFVNRARAARPDFALTPRNAGDVAALCRRLEGIPLALELAAGWTRLLTPSQIVERSGEGCLDLLVSRRRDLPARQATLRDALRWSCQLLSPAARALFAQLYIFRGGWTLDAADAVGGPEEAEAPTIDALIELHGCSLVTAEEALAGMRYRLLEPVREFAAEQLTPEQRDALRRRHTDYYLRLAEGASARLRGPGQQEALSLLESEHDNLRAALDACQEHGDAARYARFYAALWRFWHLGGHVREGGDRAAALPATLADADLSALAHAHEGAARLTWLLGDRLRCEAHCETATLLFARAGDRVGELTLRYFTTTNVVLRTREQAATLPPLNGALRRACRAAGDRLRLADAIKMHAGFASRRRQDHPRAMRFLARAAALYEAAGDRYSHLAVLSDMGTWSWWDGDHALAERLLTEALALARDLESRREATIALWSLGNVALAGGDLERAVERLGDAVAAARALHDPVLQCYSLCGLSQSLLALGRDGEALARFRACEEVARTLTRRSGFVWKELIWSLEGQAAIACPEGAGPSARRAAAELLGAAWGLGRTGPGEEAHGVDVPPPLRARYAALRATVRTPRAAWEAGRERERSWLRGGG